MTGAKLLAPVLTLGMAAAPEAALAEEPGRWRFGLSYTADLLANVSGGVEKGAAWLGRADATLRADGAAVGLPGARFFFDLIYTHGPDFSGRKVGDAQVVSNVQADGILRPYEAYAELPLGSGLTAKAGLVDLNTEFDVQSVGAFFTNSSHGIGIDFSQTGANGPSIFPVTGSAAMIRWESERARISAGLFNAISGDPERPRNVRLSYPGQDGSLLVAETALPLAPGLRAQVGGWLYTSQEPVIDAPDRTAKGSKGAYGQIEFVPGAAGAQSGLAAWARIGAASNRTNRVTAYLGGGVTYGTDESRVGLAVAHARQSGRAARHFAPEEGPQAAAETSLELGYARQVSDYLTVQPLAHYVINPGWRADVPDAVVVGVRLSFAVEQ